MTKRMLIDAVHPQETRVVIADDDRIIDFDFVTTAKTQIKGNIYLAKITRVEPSLQAAFVEYGGNKQGFLPFAEIHPDYYQLPSADRQKLIEEQIAEAEAEEAEEEKLFEQQQRYNTLIVGREEDVEVITNTHADFAEMSHDAPAQMPVDVENAAHTSYATAEIPAFTSSSAIIDLPASVVESPASDIPEAVAQDNFSIDAFLPQDLPETMLSSYGEETAIYEVNDVPQDVEEHAQIDTSVEILSGDDEAFEASSSRKSSARAIHRRYRIGEVIKRNQIILVQIIKEERGNKGASLTTYISLAGRYAVLMPNSPKGGGISRKITDNTTRKRLKEIASDLKTNRGMSVIIRTAGLDKSMSDIKRDYEYLTKLWNQVREQTLASTAPAAVYEEGDIIKRSIRDLYTSDIQEILVDGESAYNDAKDFMAMLMPEDETLVKKHVGHMPLLAAYNIEEQMNAMNEPQVKLPSGGYLVIQQTEALISIDVNSGRSTSERNVEDTAIKTNLEAAAEVGRQLRLRDLAGLIVVDFIDMNYGKNRRLVERGMKDALKQDRAKIQLGRISSFGLMELSRQRMRPSISEAQGTICPHCKGTGFIQSVETVAIQIIRTLEREAASGEYASLRVSTYAEAALYLLNEKRALLRSIEERYRVSVLVNLDSTAFTGSFRLIKISADGKELLHEENRDKGKRGAAQRKRGRRGGRNRFGESDSSSSSEDQDDGDDDNNNDYESSNIVENNETSKTSDDLESTHGDDSPRESRDGASRPARRERGRRGGRNRRPDRNNERNNDRNNERNNEHPGNNFTHASPTGIALDDYASNSDDVALLDPTATASQSQGDAQDSQPREPRGDRRPRRRTRGGQGRRDRAPREYTPREFASAESNVVTPAVTSWAEPSFVAPASSHKSHASPESTPIISVQSTAHAPTHTPAPDTGDTGPKRRGWWSRVLEG